MCHQLITNGLNNPRHALVGNTYLGLPVALPLVCRMIIAGYATENTHFTSWAVTLLGRKQK